MTFEANVPAPKFPIYVERVIDGDTFVVGESTIEFDVRLFNVRKVSFTIGGQKVRVKDFSTAERGEAGGAAATAEAKRLFTVFAGDIHVQAYEDRMSFERYVCDVWCGDILFRERMVKSGFGTHTPFYKTEAGRWAYGSTRTGKLTVQHV